jgi:ubiquinone/menaquinone biosynthesis C-methylase UbiE
MQREGWINSMTETSEIWTDEAAAYDRARPTPPQVLLDILMQLIDTSHPALVVDLGSGTGLSTMIWAERAQRVVGIEPNADMRTQAIRKIEHSPHAAHIEYQDGVSNQTNLPNNSADIVTCAQSFHWMEPTSTLAEIARILRPGGVFAVYDYTWPPTLNWELEHVYQEIDERFDALEEERGLIQNLPRWPKAKHLDRIRDSGYFRFTRELFLHHIEQGDATRFIDMVLTNAYGHQFKQNTITEQEVGFERLKQAAYQHIGSEPIPWYFSYKVRIGIK